MTKKELMPELLKAVNYKMAFCTEKIKNLDRKAAKNEMKALHIQKNLCNLAKAAISHTRPDDDICPKQIYGWIDPFLASRDELSSALSSLAPSDAEAFKASLYVCVFLKHFLADYEKEKENASSPERGFEANLKYSYTLDLIKSMGAVYEALGGMEGAKII